MANRLLTFARLAYEVAGRSVPDRRHRFAPQRYTQPQILACVLLKEYLGLDYRTAREAIELSGPLREALGLRTVPDHTTLWRFARDGASPDVVAAALGETVALLRGSGRESGPDPPLVAVDSTGLYCGHASRYFDQRRAKGSASTYKARAYQKWAAALWTGPQLVTAQLSKPGPCGDYGPWTVRSTSRRWPRPRSPPCPARRSWPTPGTTARRTTRSAGADSA